MKQLAKRNSVSVLRQVTVSNKQVEFRDMVGKPLGRFEELYDLAPISFFTLNKRGVIVGLNKTAGKLLGFTTGWLQARPFVVFVARADVGRFLNLLTRMRGIPNHHERMEISLWINNQSVPVQISMKSSASDGELVYRMAVIDLSETKAIEMELKETLNNWYSLVENAPDIIMTVDRAGKINFINRDAWGYPSRSFIGSTLTDYVSPKDAVKLTNCITAVFTSEHPSTCEIASIDPEQGHCYSFSFGPVIKPDRFVTSTTTVTIRDITRHKRMEESLRASREQLRAFAARLDQVREEERMRVAREIHDELGQALTILKMDLAWLQGKTNGNDGPRKKIKSMISDVDQTIEHVRRIVSELRPSILDEMGLTAALEWHVSQFQERTGIRGVFECRSDNVNLPQDTAAALFRVVQEALTNVMRHANARQVRVAMKSAGRVLRIVITDDGKGLSRQQMSDLKSFGIVGMRERVHRIGGEFNIFSGPGRGTRLEIVAPIQ